MSEKICKKVMSNEVVEMENDCVKFLIIIVPK